MKNNGILVIHPYLKSNRMSKDYCLEEAVNLIKAIGLDCVESSAVGLEKISSKTFLNIGYIKKLKYKISELKIELILININLSPIQQRNLENELNCKVLDRTALILEIFGSEPNQMKGN